MKQNMVRLIGLYVMCLAIGLATGRMAVFGQTPSATTSTVTVSPPVIPTNGTSTITVQLKEADGTNLTTGGATVSFVTPSSGSIGSVTDNNNGTYTAIYTAGATTGAVAITPTLSGTNFTNRATVTVGSAYVLDGTSGNTTEAHTFTTDGNLTLFQGFFVDYLIVGGGGGGAGTNGGGGGAGGFLQGNNKQLSGLSHAISVGAGGAGANNGRGANGASSSAFGLTALGGGGGSGINPREAASNGASGGGGSGEPGTPNEPGAGTAGQGNMGGVGSGTAGYLGGGGGGAGAVGGNAVASDRGGNGGNGLQSSITGSLSYYSGGGGGGARTGFNGGSGGLGGGGKGSNSGIGQDGAPNTGGGGGGGAYISTVGQYRGGNGGSGVVIVRYEGDALSSIGGTVTSFTGNGTIGENGVPYQVHTFASNGNVDLSGSILNQRLGTSLTSSIGGSGNLTYSGPGRLILEANSSYSGTTTISGGTLQIGNGDATGSLGTGAITNNANLVFNRNNTYTLGGGNVLSGTGIVEQIGSGTLDLGGITSHSAGTWILRNGSISNGTLAGNFTLESGSIAALLGGSGNLTKNTGGTVTLSANNTYSGTTTLNAGTLIVNGTHSGTSATAVNSGARLKGTGALAGTTTVSSGATVEGGNSIGTLGFDNLTLTGGGNYNWQIDDATGMAGTNWDQLSVSGTLTITANSGNKFNINVWSLLSDGSNGELANFKPTESLYTWPIITAGSITGFDAAAFQINTDPINGTGGLISPYQVDGFTVIQQGNTIALQYDPPSAQTIDGTNNGTEVSNYTTSNTAGALTLDLGFFADYLIVGGGGGGAGTNGGGGGAGGFLQGNNKQLSGLSHAISVGAGGAGANNGRGANGASSSAFGLTALGGGGGSGINPREAASNGASGGGGSGEPGTPNEPGAGTAGQGNMGGVGSGTAGYLGGGGGGAGAVGGNAVASDRGGNGGNGLQSSITGSLSYYSGGGGGGARTGFNGGSGGLGGGGKGSNSGIGQDGAPNTGGGGGGGAYISTVGQFRGGNGGSGVVIIRYAGNALSNVGGTVTTFTGDGTIGLNGVPYQVHTFTTNGNFDLSQVDFDARLSATLSGNIVGTGKLVYDSQGRLTLTGSAHNYTGATEIKNGELRVNSDISSSSGVTVDATATLSGTGTLPATTINGVHNPGNSPGLQTFSDLTYGAGSTLNWELATNSVGTRGTDYDAINVTGNLDYAGATTLNLIFDQGNVDWADNFWDSPALGTSGWKLFEVSGTVSNLENLTINVADWTDANGDAYSADQPGVTPSFQLEQSGTGIYLTYEPLAPDATTSTVSASASSIAKSTSTTLTIQLKDANGNNITAGGETITFVATTLGTIGTVTDNGDGTYTATYTAGASTGTETITPILNSTNFTNTLTLTIVDQVLSGTQVLDGTSGNTQITDVFTTDGNLTLSQGFFVDYLVVGGGGGGGGDNAGGGGGGGLLTGSTGVTAISHPITVGLGGSGGTTSTRGGNGGNSSAFGLTAIGGGGGASGDSGTPARPSIGGSGGGGEGESSGSLKDGAAGTTGQGFAGGNGSTGGGGGGGGAGAAGANANAANGGKGGDGLEISINGTATYYAGGGGGGSDNNSTFVSSGGLGGGGQGKQGTGDSGTNGLGGGGGGATFSGSATGGAGGSGIVIVRYVGESLGSIGGSVTSFEGTGSNGGDTGVTYNVNTFTSTGTFDLSGVDLSTRLGARLNNSISGTGDLIYNGPGNLTLPVGNTYTGNTYIGLGQLRVEHDDALGTGFVYVGTSTGSGTGTNGVLELSGGLNISNPIKFYGNSALTATRILNVYGTNTLANDITLDAGGGSYGVSSEGDTLVIAGDIKAGSATSNRDFYLRGRAEGLISGDIIGTGFNLSLIKQGNGVWTLTGANSYTGTTTVDGGTLIVNGTHSGTGAVLVNAAATLKGIGTLAGPTTVNAAATIIAGNSIGTLGLSDLTLEGGGNLNWQIDNAGTQVTPGVPGTDWDLLNVSGALTINATSGNKFNINLWSLLDDGTNGELANFKPTETFYQWTIITAGSISGFSADKFQVNLDPMNGTGGLISPYQVDGFSVIQDGNSIKLQYDPPASQTLDGTNNGTESSNYTTSNTAGALTLDLGFFADYLIVGGGGGGGGDNGGGGGAGGLLTNLGRSSIILFEQDYPVVVGAGGAGGAVNARGANGSNSSLFGFTAIGGGGGGGGNAGSGPGSGGSGGGGDGEVPTYGANSTSGQGFPGGNGVGGDQGGGGGGGAGGPGANGSGAQGGAGGIGVQNTITGTSVYYAGGGGAGPSNFTNLSSSGGQGGGGNGGLGAGVNGTANTGSGGGGAGWNGSTANGGSGGSGVVIVRYAGPSIFDGTAANGTGTASGYTVHTFTSSGNFDLSQVDFNARLKATLSGNIIGNGDLIYDSKGRLNLTGTNTYDGQTIIENGELRVNSSLTTSSGVLVKANGILSGTGDLPPLDVYGKHRPGNSPGVQRVHGDATYRSGAIIEWELNSNDAGLRGFDFDGIDVYGDLVFEPGVELQLVFNHTGSQVDWSDPYWNVGGLEGVRYSHVRFYPLFSLMDNRKLEGLNEVEIHPLNDWKDARGRRFNDIHPDKELKVKLIQSGKQIIIQFEIQFKTGLDSKYDKDISFNNHSKY